MKTVHLIKEVQNLQLENFQTLLKEIMQINN
jgi:hypothetical protein